MDREVEVDYSLSRIDDLSRKVLTLCKIAPSSTYHMDNLHKTGGLSVLYGNRAEDGAIVKTAAIIPDRNGIGKLFTRTGIKI